jgi:hypothetical protein
LRAYRTILLGNLLDLQVHVTILHKRRIDCDVTINYVYFDVAFLFLNSLCFYSFTQ